MKVGDKTFPFHVLFLQNKMVWSKEPFSLLPKPFKSYAYGIEIVNNFVKNECFFPFVMH